MLGKVSLGTVGLVVGGILTVIGFVAYFSQSATLNLIGFFYGIPLLLGGLALKAAELEPIPFTQPTQSDVLALREQQATSTQNQIRRDVTRYRYGQSAHLDSSLSALGLSPNDEERPVLRSLYETEIDGAYALVLEFDSYAMSFEAWQHKQPKMETFFGPGLRVELSQPSEEQVNVALIALPETQTAE